MTTAALLTEVRSAIAAARAAREGEVRAIYATVARTRLAALEASIASLRISIDELGSSRATQGTR